jgi:hypothetical protein
VELLRQQAKPQTVFIPPPQVIFIKAVLETAESQLARLLESQLEAEALDQTVREVMGVILTQIILTVEVVEQMAAETGKIALQFKRATVEQVV